jgi:hypothetical protein
MTTEEPEEVTAGPAAHVRLPRGMKKNHLLLILLLCLTIAVITLSVVVIILAINSSKSDGNIVTRQPDSTPTAAFYSWQQDACNENPTCSQQKCDLAVT